MPPTTSRSVVGGLRGLHRPKNLLEPLSHVLSRVFVLCICDSAQHCVRLFHVGGEECDGLTTYLYLQCCEVRELTYG